MVDDGETKKGEVRDRFNIAVERLASVETSVVCLAARSARSVSLVRWRFRIWWPTVRAKTSSYSSAMK
jgi:hypothetical protein